MSRTEEAFLAAYDAHADALFRFCYAFIGHREDAKDAVQEAFTRTWKYIAGGRRVEEMRPFLYRTARNILIDRSRKAREQSLDELRESGWDAGDPHAVDPMLSAEAARAIRLTSQMEAPYREALLMRYLDGMMPREIARASGETENAVSVRIHRGLEKLKNLIRPTHE